MNKKNKKLDEKKTHFLNIELTFQLMLWCWANDVMAASEFSVCLSTTLQPLKTTPTNQTSFIYIKKTMSIFDNRF